MKSSTVLDAVLVVEQDISISSINSYLTLQSHIQSFHVNNTFSIFETVLNLLKPLNTQLSMNTSHQATQSQAMSLMLLLYNLIATHPLVCPSYLRSAANAIQPITKWPNPHGDVALILMTALELEMKAPGSGMWKKAIADVPVLSQNGQRVSDICLQTIAGAITREKKAARSKSRPTGTSKTSSSTGLDAEELKLAQAVKRWELISSSVFVYVAPQKTDRNAWYFSNLCKPKPNLQKRTRITKLTKINTKKNAKKNTKNNTKNVKKNTKNKATNKDMEQNPLKLLRRNLLLSTLSWDLDLSNSTTALIQRLQDCSSLLLREWFATARQVLSQASRLPTLQDAHLYRVTVLSQLLREILPNCIPKTRETTSDLETHRTRLFMPTHKGTELQFKPIDATSELEYLDLLSTNCPNLKATPASAFKYHPLATSTDVVGTRNYLNYNNDFGDFDEIALGARVPNAEIDAAGFVTNTPTSEKISKLRGDAAEYLASASSASSCDGSTAMPKSNLNSRRKSISAWSDNNPDNNPDNNSDYNSNNRNTSTRFGASTKKTRVARDIEHQRRAHYEHTSNTLRRFQFNGNYMTESIDEMNPSILRLAALGGTNVLHRLLCGYVATQHRHALDGDLENVDVSTYIIPTGHSDLAEYIGQHDSWYRCHVLTPFHSNSNIWQLPNPEKTLVPLLTNYLSEAKQTLPIAIFDCECWFDEVGKNTAERLLAEGEHFKTNSKSKLKSNNDNNESNTSLGKNRDAPDLTIPFCSRMTIGLHTQVAMRQDEIQITTKSTSSTTSTSLTWTETLMDKKFGTRDRCRAEMLDIKYSEIGLDGIEQEPQTISDSFHVVNAMNLPAAYQQPSQSQSHMAASVNSSLFTRKSHDAMSKNASDQIDLKMDPAFPMDSLPDPTSHSLDVCFVGSNGNVHDILKKCVLKKHDIEHLNESLKIETSQLSVAWMDIRSKSGKPLYVCLDGKICGPFIRIVLKPCEAIGKGDPLSLPVSHFFPSD